MRGISSIFVLVFASMLLLGFTVVMAEQPIPTSAPKLELEDTDPEPGRGFVPPPMDLSYIDGSHMDVHTDPADFPTRYDLRELGYVTDIRNQSSCGACYAFASLGNIESKMLVDSEGTFDFSENNIKECNYYETSCDGGNYYKMASFLSKYGTVLETCDPYVAGDVTCNSSCTYQKTLLSWDIITGAAVASTDDIKTILQTYGAVYTTIYSGDASDVTWESEFSSYDGSYTLYYTGTYTPNHAVLIVGWDDTLSHSGGTGGWIVKNSWGTSWGGTCDYGSESGYFYIAYGSALIGYYSSYMSEWQDYDDNGDIYYYDEGGWTNTWGYGSATTGYTLSKFTPTSNSYLKRVELWTNDATVDIDIEIYDDFDGSSLTNLIGSEYNATTSAPGYHSILLTSPVSISSGDAIYVKLKIENSTEAYPIISDSESTIETSTTYISSSGSDASWTDLGTDYSNDVAVRIRTSSSVGIDDDRVELPINTLMLSNYPNPFNQSTTIEFGIPGDSRVTLVVYDILGRQVETLVDDYLEAGYHSTDWDSNNKPTGYYFYKLTASGSEKVGKMLLLK